MTVPSGVTAIVISAKGHVMGSASCFERSGAAGFTLAQNQERTARALAIKKAIDNMCNDDLASVIDHYEAGQLMQKLEKVGYRVETIAVNHDTDESKG